MLSPKVYSGWPLAESATYLEDHPRACKWLGSAPFISHKKAIWKGSHKPILRGLAITMVINLNHLLTGMIFQVYDQNNKNGPVFALLISLHSPAPGNNVYSFLRFEIRRSWWGSMHANQTKQLRQMMLTSCFCRWTRPPLSSTQLHNSFPSQIGRETPLFLWLKCSLTPYQLQMNHFLSQRTPHVFYKPKKPSYLDQRRPARFAAQEEALQCL